jgi:aspartyl-tRNA(Asn)/glutamyl-tRNA(Gln) amidotransferase subunit A
MGRSDIFEAGMSSKPEKWNKGFMKNVTLETASISQLHQALIEKQVTAAGLLDEAAGKHERLGSLLNAFVCLDANAAKQAEAADAALAVGIDSGPLQGLPIGIKDIFGVNGLKTYGGSPMAWPEQWNQEGPIVSRLRQQAAVFFGKNQTVEFASGSLGTNAHWGAPRNPWDANNHRVSGGSSSGAGVGVLQGSTVLSLASDAGGSIRVPASLTGTVGLKTSIGRWTMQGALPLYPTQDTIGIITRSVEDALLGFVSIDAPGADWRAILKKAAAGSINGRRIGVAQQFYRDCSPDIVARVNEALAELEAQGAELVDVDFPEFDDTVAFNRGGSLTNPEASALIQDEFAAWIPTIDPNVWDRLRVCGDISSREYLQKRRWIASHSAIINKRIYDLDLHAFASPTTCITAPRLDEVADVESYRNKNVLVHRNSYPANVWDLCSLTMPVALDGAGLPIGLQLCAGRGRELELLEVAVAAEKVLGRCDKRLGRPPLVVEGGEASIAGGVQAGLLSTQPGRD